MTERSGHSGRPARVDARADGDRAGRIERAARWLVAQHRDRVPFAGFPSALSPRDLDEAYAVQDAFVRNKARHCGPVSGWKIALSNPAMQRFVGLHEPVAGCLFARQVVASPARTRAAAYGRLLVEFEIAVELGVDLAPIRRRYTRTDVRDAVAAVRPAFELADDRGADYAMLAAHGLQLVADNAWNEGAVLGEGRSDWRSLDLAAARGVVRLDGNEIGAGYGRDLMGDPLDALAWLADSLSRRGITMRAGDVAILGSLVTSKFPLAGQRLQFALEGFAPIELAID
jgi:2-keto-4-pentenoate hydratase